ncbi:uncharacterized protein VTP21DRAFT_5164 [Calcarisporiella thermophila]|uniref:uncharacterized protein n=1 Tax=Calcarisporiella thermophila TaxID=911321 RepID=UPI003742F5AB
MNGTVVHPAVIEVPLKEQDQTIEIPLTQLDNATFILQILNDEAVEYKYWIRFASEYNRQNRPDESIQLLEAALKAPHLQEQTRHRASFHNILATLSIQKYRTTLAERKFWLDKAKEHANEASRLYQEDSRIFTVKGLVFLAENKINDALINFQNALKLNPDDYTALVGKARIQYYKKDYEAALETLQRALQIQPYGKPDVRLGIGLCYHRLEMPELARQAFERCVKLDSGNSTALILLAIYEWNDSKQNTDNENDIRESVAKATTYMEEAFRARKYHPVVLDHMANYYIFQRKFQEALGLAIKAHELSSLSNNDRLTADTLYQIARTYHLMEQYNEAYKHYEQAVKRFPEHMQAQYAMGQMHIWKNEHQKAIKCFERVLVKHPKNLETLKVLGSLHFVQGDKQKAYDYFNKVVSIVHENQLQLDDPAMLVELGLTQEETDTKKSVKALQAAANIYEENQGWVAPELLNNIGALSHMEGRLDSAEVYYKRALESYEQLRREQEENFPLSETEGMWVTITYNLARLAEERQDTTRAMSLYQRILDQYGTYIDAHLRLGAIEQSMGRVEAAEERFKDALGVDKNAEEAWLMLGWLEAESGRVRPSKKTFEKVLKECNRHDIYALCALGNHHLMGARELKGEDKREMRATAYRYAVDHFIKVLAHDPNNIYAANGIAIAMAENDELVEAKDIFLQVRECAQCSAPWINLGHVYMQLGQYRSAIITYEGALKRFKELNSSVLIFLARAQYMLAKQEKSRSVMVQAIATTQKALKLQPSNRSYLFDVALLQQEYVQLIAEQPIDQRDLETLKGALERIESAQRLFRALSEVPAEEHVYYDRKTVTYREKFSDSLRTQVQRRIQEQEEYEKKKQRDLEEKTRKLEEERKRKEEEEAAIRQREEEERQATERARQEIMEKLREEYEKQREEAKMELDDEEDGEGEEKEEGRKRRREKGGERKQRKKRKSMTPESEIQSAERVDANESGEDMPVERRKRKFKSKEIIESEDEE